MLLDGIKNIIFDLGGVIINIRFQLALDAFQKLSKSGKVLEFTQQQQSALFDAYETGRISDTEFRDGLRQHYEIEATDEEIDAAWNALLLDIPKERIALLRELGKKYRLFLLSNTNAIHLVKFTQLVADKFTIPSLDALFEKTYYSHLIGQRKPDAIVFEQILAQNNLQAAETLFVDDSIQHIEGAKTVGLHTLFLAPPLTINEAFKDAL
ncbi:hydrolase [Adhaeribacter aerolatus]|uniref:Hydrolase n=1 Tax=Adhaeribacter aerolatus TaxID=670289 RepID=A0A512ARZ7_9BACT|nr:HAD family phosphatase [Adhaeribacter aerolatus]GEO02479.1 hydrolase [Adhaeribacter aerolatus]